MRHTNEEVARDGPSATQLRRLQARGPRRHLVPLAGAGRRSCAGARFCWRCRPATCTGSTTARCSPGSTRTCATPARWRRSGRSSTSRRRSANWPRAATTGSSSAPRTTRWRSASPSSSARTAPSARSSTAAFIEELIEHPGDLPQVAESPDRGLDSQTRSGEEGERSDLRPPPDER
ncbi:MAG: hypothetical protein MZW92_48490 [Comamonadaceae bacterium]|nr:hypothetical protein [Comamonadaceae bacterium]